MYPFLTLKYSIPQFNAYNSKQGAALKPESLLNI